MGELSCWKVEGSVSSACQYFSRKGTVDHGAKPYGFITASKSEKKKKIRRLQIFFFFKNCIIKHPTYIGMSVLGQQKVNSWFVRSHLLLFLLTPVPLTGFIVHEQQARPGFLSHHYFKHFLTLKEWRTQRRRQRLCSQHLAAEVTHCATNLTSHCSPLPSALLHTTPPAVFWLLFQEKHQLEYKLWMEWVYSHNSARVAFHIRYHMGSTTDGHVSHGDWVILVNWNPFLFNNLYGQILFFPHLKCTTEFIQTRRKNIVPSLSKMTSECDYIDCRAF